MANELPQEIIESKILTRLPVKSLIRFTSVSKRWRSVILYNPKFAKSQFELASKQKSITHRILVSNSKGSPELKCLDMESPWFGQSSCSSCRKVCVPFEQQPPRECYLLGSCNGLVFVASEDSRFYIWNPSTKFFKKLPHLGYSSDEKAVLDYYGAGYMSATDNYKVLVGYFLKKQNEEGHTEMVHIFSLEDHIWRIIDVDYFGDIFPCHQGMLSNEALHWLHDYGDSRIDLVAFDLDKEEFSILQLPDLDTDGTSWYRCLLGVVGGCLCVSSYMDEAIASESVDFWVMREYGVCDSWTKLFNLDFSNLPVQRLLRGSPCTWFATETGTVGVKRTGNGVWFMKIDHKDKEKLGLYMIEGNQLYMVEYEESLVWIEEKENAKETQTSSPSRKKLKS
ncbi:PREDICTED: F-box protein CPR30-like [Fragaria vesca subsp. vesca]|uniref:F-box protein CPR30-like n=1 Tax=Fragaria vesca subsp. vesca TaxID=101020 RepID=UPI0002C30138|nr:PREDICTED: F-box protein CPR30-like [Fragaria vesca subsp. vesca]